MVNSGESQYLANTNPAKLLIYNENTPFSLDFSTLKGVLLYLDIYLNARRCCYATLHEIDGGLGHSIRIPSAVVHQKNTTIVRWLCFFISICCRLSKTRKHDKLRQLPWIR